MNKKIEETLELIRPVLVNDGGNIEFIKFEEGIVYVRLVGACAGCQFKNQTLENGVLELLKSEIPEVKDLINVEL